MYPQPPPYHPPVEMSIDPVAAPAPKRNRLLVSIGSLVTVGLLGLGAAAIAFGGNGASSPEEAVQHLATAIGDQDVLAAIATLAPDETRSFPDLFTRASAKAKDLKVSKELGLGNGKASKNQSEQGNPFADTDVKITGLELATEQLSDDVAKVTVTAGVLSWDVPAGKDLGSIGFPLGINRLCDISGSSEEVTTSEGGTTTHEVSSACGDDSKQITDEIRHGSVDLGKLHAKASKDRPAVFIMTVDRDGWYVSPFFTAAEYARIAGKAPGTARYDVDPGPAAKSPTAAVNALADAVATKDTRKIANVLSSELSVWRAYSSAVDEKYVNSFGSDDLVSVAVSGLATHEEPIDDDRVRVVVDKAKLVMVTNEDDYSVYDDASYDEDTEVPKVKVTRTAAIDGDCVTTSSDDGTDPETTCLDDTGDGLVKALGVNRIAMVAVTDRDGWAVSPIETVADYLGTVVDHMTPALFGRLTGGLGSAPHRSPTAHLSEGSNNVKLDEAGMAVVDVTFGDGEFAQITGDDGVHIRIDTADSDVVGPGTHTAVVTAPIGTKSATVAVAPIEVTDIAATAPDGTPTGPITGRVQSGEQRAFRLSGADYQSLMVDAGSSLSQNDYDATGEYLYGDGAGESTVVVIITNDPTMSDPNSADPGDEFTLTFLPKSGGFAGSDPTIETIDLGEESDGTTSLAVAEGHPFDLTIDTTAPATVQLMCSSGQFDPPATDNSDSGFGMAPFEVMPGTPFSARFEPTESEHCYVTAYPSFYDDATTTETTETDPASPPTTVAPPDVITTGTVTIRAIPAS